jgi:hypothetical protein
VFVLVAVNVFTSRFRRHRKAGWVPQSRELDDDVSPFLGIGPGSAPRLSPPISEGEFLIANRHT